MGETIVCDHVLWAKRVEGDPQLVNRIHAMHQGETIALVVDGIPGIWERMADGSGRPTFGLKPVGAMKAVWSSLYRDRRGERVTIGMGGQGGSQGGPDGGSPLPIEEPSARSEEERRAAWQAFLDLGNAGWRSAAGYGPRDELYGR